MEDCGPEPSIEGDLRREAAGERGAQGWGRPPRGFTSISLWGRGDEKHASLGPEQTHAAPPPPSRGPSDSSFPPQNRPPPKAATTLQPPQVPAWPGNQFRQSSSLVTQWLRQQPPGNLTSSPNWQVMTAPPGPGEPVTSASGGGNEVGGVEGLEPAWGVSGASKQGREIKQIPLGPSLGGGSPAFPWLGQPNPPGQWLLLGSGRSKAAGLEGLWWARTQGNAGGLSPGN